MESVILGAYTAYIHPLQAPSPSPLNSWVPNEALLDWRAVLMKSLGFPVNRGSNPSISFTSGRFGISG